MPDEPILIDLFCKAGGCTKGYQRAGFYVIGVDIEPQPNYCGDEFYEADALTFDLARGDAVHASPPCHASSSLRHVNGKTYVNLIPPTRERLGASGLPYVIENVVGAELISPTKLCGSSFGLDVERHRLFETNWPLMGPPCAHGAWLNKYRVYQRGRWYESPVAHVWGGGGGKAREHWSEVMEIDWMTDKELAQAIPPAYTELIGQQLLAHVQ